MNKRSGQYEQKVDNSIFEVNLCSNICSGEGSRSSTLKKTKDDTHLDGIDPYKSMTNHPPQNQDNDMTDKKTPPKISISPEEWKPNPFYPQEIHYIGLEEGWVIPIKSVLDYFDAITYTPESPIKPPGSFCTPSDR